MRAISKALVAVFMASSAAAEPFRAWIDFGAEIPGESRDVGREGWSEVRTFSTARRDKRFSLACHRLLGKSSPALAAACVDERIFPVVRIDVARTEPEGGQMTYWQLELHQVRILSFGQTGGADVLPEETLELDWESAEFIYRVVPPQGSPYPVSRLVSEDSDGDGLPDVYERRTGLDPLADNRDLDSDGDGLPDGVEYRLGTDPLDGSSFFRVLATAPPDGGEGLAITWPSVSGESYRIEFSPDLVTPFAPFATVLARGPETSHTVSKSAARGFFRVRPANDP